MSHIEKYIDAFVEAFELDDRNEAAALEYQSIENWDSVGHMTLISELEDIFEISMETDDIVEFSSFVTGKTIMKKYEVVI
ncbi:acyl carrier protein [Gammaproteobacteria bacterium 45_16_T64]|nr:acyl carrier protein [Gammaproteobacteria bacterium 45_16_T64]